MQDPSPILRTPPILSSIASLGSVQIIPANCPIVLEVEALFNMIKALRQSDNRFLKHLKD